MKYKKGYYICVMEEQNERGKPGRKPIDDKKIPITVYIEESVISTLGDGWLITGKDIARAAATTGIYAKWNDKNVSREKD